MTDKIKEEGDLLVSEWAKTAAMSLSDLTLKAITSEAAREYWEGQGWVRVEDGLPPEESKFYYWLYSESIDNYEQGEYDYERKCFQDKYGDRLMYVTHWAIPSPPKTDNL